MIFTSACLHVHNTATGSGAAVKFAGQAYKSDGTALVDITTTALTFSAADHRSMARWRPDGRLLVTKAAISAADLVMDNGIARTLDGKQYVVTLAAAGAVHDWIEGLPYNATGALRVNEV